MQRRFNYTDRLRIFREDAKFTLQEKNGKFFVSSNISLKDYGLPSDGLVFAEAYRQTTWMRFSCGTIGGLSQLADIELTEFESSDDILFRLKVASPGTLDDPHGRLLAEADTIPLASDDEKEFDIDPLLPIRSLDLGDEVWRMNFDDKPTLLINQKAAPNWKQFALHPIFRSLVYPSALRQIFHHVIFTLGIRDSSDNERLDTRWLRFASEILAVGDPPEEEDALSEWIEDAVTAFAKKHQLLEHFVSAWSEEGGEG